MKKIITAILLFAILSSKAQLFEDFSDGELIHDPAWSGQTGHFAVNDAKQLQLFTSGAGTAMLATENQLTDSTEWRFWIRMGFSPSSNNFGRIYLASDQSDLSGPLNGYYIQFGESGAEDAIELFRQNGLSSQSVCRGKEGFVAGPFSLKIKVYHHNDGLWTIYSAQEGTSSFQLEASGTDSDTLTSAFFGIVCTYTNSNSQRFYFDDILIRHIQPDTISPRVEKFLVADDASLMIKFSEDINEQDAESAANYFLGSDGSNPVSAGIDMMDPSQVHILFERPFANGSTDLLSIANIHDLAGNRLRDTTVAFSYYCPQAFDLLINEIMADPSPPKDLPAVEYIELFNVTTWPLSLKDWTLNLGSVRKTFPEVCIPAGAYLLVTRGDELRDAGPCVSMLPSDYSLSNEGATLMLSNPNEQLIHAVSYSTGWCTDDWKAEGGWSLEMIDPFNPCGEETNWAISKDPAGGTPGRVNSVFATNPDTVAPRLSRAGIESDDGIRIWFSEKLDSSRILNTQKYILEPLVGQPSEIYSAGDSYHSLILHFSSPMLDTTAYTLCVADTLSDCSGNIMMKGACLPVGIPCVPGLLDAVINEVLLDPMEDGADFIEIYNRSGKFIDLKDLILARLDTITSMLVSPQELTTESHLMAPGSFRVLTPDPSWVMEHYYCPDPDVFIRMPHWISFSKEVSVIILARKNDEQIIDQVSYRESLHFDLFNTTEGISLERIHYDRPSEDPTNWHSASQTSGYATPGYPNSQFGTAAGELDEWIKVEPEVFTPDNDGLDDLLHIHCTPPAQGYVISVYIFNPDGRRIRELVNNSMMGVKNTYSWDGKDDGGWIMDPGIYLVYAQAFDLQGNVITAKRPSVLVSRYRR